MARALELADRAATEGEVPVGALVVREGEIIAEAWNRPIATHDPTAHAEILALREAGRCLNNYRLSGCVLYVTLEPCPMCVGAMIHARVERVVFGAHDPKTGALGGAMNLAEQPSHNHQLQVTGGVLADRAGGQLRGFFRERRRRAKQAGRTAQEANLKLASDGSADPPEGLY